MSATAATHRLRRAGGGAGTSELQACETALGWTAGPCWAVGWLGLEREEEGWGTPLGSAITRSGDSARERAGARDRGAGGSWSCRGEEKRGERPGEPLGAGLAVGKPANVNLSGEEAALAAVLRPRLRSRRTGRGIQGGWAKGTSELVHELGKACKTGSETEPAGQGPGGSVAGGGVELNPVSAGSVDRWGVKLNLR
jgi:hypothetical protein